MDSPVFGADYKVDRYGNPIETGIGSVGQRRQEAMTRLAADEAEARRQQALRAQHDPVLQQALDRAERAEAEVAALRAEKLVQTQGK